MIILKILGIVVAVFVLSIWLTAVISAGVESGLRRYFDKKN